MSFKKTAQSYYKSGLVPLPCQITVDENKVKHDLKIQPWLKFQTEFPTLQEFNSFDFTKSHIAIATGLASGNLECIDFDMKGKYYTAWRDSVNDQNGNLFSKLVIEQTQSGGFHVFYRCREIEGNQVLAMINTEMEPVLAIETRGTKGLVFVAPSPNYRLIQNKFETMPIITPEERNILINTAKAFNQVKKPEIVPAEIKKEHSIKSNYLDETNDVFGYAKHNINVPELLTKNGWKVTGRQGDNAELCRPGKDKGISGHWNGVVFNNFSSSVTAFLPNSDGSGKGYSAFDVYQILEHDQRPDLSDTFAFKQAVNALEDLMPQPKEIDVKDLDKFLLDKSEKNKLMKNAIFNKVEKEPEGLYDVPGFVKMFTEHTLANAPRPNKSLAFSGALLAQAMLVGRKVVDIHNTSPHLYVMNFAFTGHGKDAPRKMNFEMFEKLNMSHMIGRSIATPEGLEDKLSTDPAVLYQIDEVDGLINAASQKGNTTHRILFDLIKELFTSACSIFPKRTKARKLDDRENKMQNEVIKYPFVCLLGSTSEKNYYESMNYKMMTDGFFSRFIFIKANKRARFNAKAGQFEINPEVMEIAEYWKAFGGSEGEKLFQFENRLKIDYTQGAKDKLDKIIDYEFNKYEKCEEIGDEIGCAIWSRYIEMTKKMAIIYACSDNYRNPLVNERALGWADKFMLHQISSTLKSAVKYIATTKEETVINRILNMLRESGSGIVFLSEIMKKMKELKANDIKMIIQTMTLRDLVVYEKRMNPDLKRCKTKKECLVLISKDY